MKHFMTPIPKAMCTGTPTCDTKNTDISSHSPDDSKAWICPKIIQNIFQMIAPNIHPTQNLFKTKFNVQQDQGASVQKNCMDSEEMYPWQYTFTCSGGGGL